MSEYGTFRRSLSLPHAEEITIRSKSSPASSDQGWRLKLRSQHRTTLQRLSHASPAQLVLGAALIGSLLLVTCVRLPVLLGAAERLAADASWNPRRLVPSAAFCERGAPLVCAHGGDASAGHPANTREAVLAAAAAGAHCVELDLSTTSDGRLVPLHARELQLLSGRPRLQVDDLALAEVESLEWPSGERVPDVERLIRELSPRVSLLTLDVKLPLGREGERAAVAAAVAALVAAARCGNCLVWSKSDAFVAAYQRKSAASQLVGYIVAADAADEALARPLRLAAPEVLAVHHAMLTPAVVAAARAAGKRVHAFVADTPATAAAILAAGVDGVVWKCFLP
ncbi:hypothetical protein WJX81_007363 [Elliptochloris bilobata]|uniref:glycerophosphodiester phosphodiesterase n=1 Tax=Elliptochloris bilobata TaxID=381761 RepID=A0AAW1RTF9_9CHLO